MPLPAAPAISKGPIAVLITMPTTPSLGTLGSVGRKKVLPASYVVIREMLSPRKGGSLIKRHM